MLSLKCFLFQNSFQVSLSFFFSNFLDAEELETSVHGRGGQEGGVFAEFRRRGHGRVVVERAQTFPLLDEIDADVAAGHRQIRAGLIEGQILDFVGVVQVDGFEVLELSQVPQFDRRIVRRSRQIITIFGKGQRRNRPRMTGEIGHFGSIFEIPNANVRVSRAGAEDQPVRVELGAGETRAGSVADFDHHVARFNVGESPMRVRRAGE